MSIVALGHTPMERLQPFGPLGFLSGLVFSLAAAVFTSGWRVGIAFILVLGLALIFSRAALEPLKSKRLWLLFAVLFLSSLLLMDPDNLVWGITLSAQVFSNGLQMILRAGAIVIAVASFSSSVSIGELAALFEQAGMKGLGFALGVAVNMLPLVQETATTAFQALRMRGGFRKRRIQALRLLLITTVVASLRHAEDIVCAAEARAFSAERSVPRRVTWQPGDQALTGLLAVSFILLLAL